MSAERFQDLAEQLHNAFPGRLTLSWVQPQGVHAVWNPPPTPSEQAAFDNIVNNYDWLEKPEDRLDRLAFPVKLLAALTVRLSTQWATLPAGQKSAIQSLIDKQAARAISALG